MPPCAKTAAIKALALDNTLAEAHAAPAFAGLYYDWDWADAEREFRRAIELNPSYSNAHHWYSHFLTAMGRTEESLAESRVNIQLDPLNPVRSITWVGIFFTHISMITRLSRSSCPSKWTHALIGRTKP